MRGNFRAALRAFEVTLKTRVVSPFSYLTFLLFPIIVSSVSLFVIGTHGSAQRTAYAVLGGGLIGYWTAAYLEGGTSIQSERWDGMLEPLLGTPTALPVILAGKIAASLTLGLLSFLPALALGFWGFHASIAHVDFLPFAVSFAVLTVSLFAIALLLSPVFALWRWAFSLTNGFELGVYVLGGFVFPVSQLGPWAQDAAALLAPSWATAALYASTAPGDHPYPGWWATSLGLSACYFFLSALLFRIVHARARISGQLAAA